MTFLSTGLRAPRMRWKNDVPGAPYSNMEVPTTHVDVLAVITNPALLLTGLYTITYSGFSAVILAAGNRVLRASTTSPQLNGIYVAGVGAWTRALDADTFAEIQDAIVEWDISTLYIPPVADSALRFTLWNPSNNTIVIGTDAQEWRVCSLLGFPNITDDITNNPAQPRVVTDVPISLSGLQTIQTVSLVDDDLVLVNAQVGSVTNGLYRVHSVAWTRALCADEGFEIYASCLAPVSANGSTYQNRAFGLRTASTTPIVVGTDSQVWSLENMNNDVGFGPVRVSANFNDALVLLAPVAIGNSPPIVNLPPITPQNAGMRVGVRISTSPKQTLGSVGLVCYQPSGADSIFLGVAGQPQLALCTLGSAFELESDGLSRWVPVFSGVFAVGSETSSSFSSLAITPATLASYLGDA